MYRTASIYDMWLIELEQSYNVIQSRRRHYFIYFSSAIPLPLRRTLSFLSTYAAQTLHIHSHIPRSPHHGLSTPLHPSCPRNTDRYPLCSQSMLSVSPSPISHPPAKTLNLTRSTKNVQDTLVTKDTLLKSDKSPVTVADLSAQSLISLHLLAHFQDPIIGEEDTSELRVNEPLRQRVVGLVNGGFKKEEGWGKDKTFSEDE